MRFIDRKKARPVIPLVSLIDILTILLLFFIVASEFRKEDEEKEGKQEERRLDIALPGVSELEGNPVTDQRASISVSAEGVILLDGQTVADASALVDALQTRRAADPNILFELAPDERVPLGKVIAVWEALTKAGIPVGEVPARVLKKP